MLQRLCVVFFLFFCIPVIYGQIKTSLKKTIVKESSLGSCDNWLKLPSFPSFVQVGDLDVSGDQITVEAMFNRTTPYFGGSLFAGDLVSKHKDPVNANYLLRPNSAEMTTADGVYHVTPPVCDIELNKVYHVAMVYDGVTLKFYRNGFLLSQTPVSGNLFQNDFPTQIGLYNAELYNTNLIGYINEVRIWNVARTQAEIQANMNIPLASPTTQVGLLAYYSFNSLTNLQGNPSWDGTLGGAAAINQTNPICTFTADNNCCTAITGSFVGNEICAGKSGQFTFHPTSLPINQPYIISYSDQTNQYTQSNVLDGIPFPVSTNPSVTTNYPLLTITDGIGCLTTFTDQSATITVDPSGSLAITPDTSICANGSVQLHVSGGQMFIWTPASLLNNNMIPDPVANPVQPTRFFVTGLDPNSCITEDSVMINFLPKTVFKAPRDEATCKGFPVILTGNNDPAKIYSWTPIASLNNPSSPNPVATPDQNTVYHLVISDPVCTNYDSAFDVQVVVNEVPVVFAKKSNDLDCSVVTAQLSASGADSYSWEPTTGLDDPSSNMPVVSINATTQFVVKGTYSNGCYSFDSVTVAVNKTGENLFSVPNAFSPNNDGVNDCFGIRNWGSVTLKDFSIYNRWGQRVFQTTNPSQCWDGTFQGAQQPVGGFVYIIKASSFCQENIVRQGIVMLVR